MRYYITVMAIVNLVGLASCTKFVNAPLPTTELVGDQVYNSNSTAASAVSGIYTSMRNNSVGGGADGISAIAGLSADDFGCLPGVSPVLEQAYENSQTSQNPSTIWSDLYNLIYQANSAITGISSSTGVDSAMKQQLIGEAEVVRAFAYFYLVNLYGNVPLVLTPNYQESEVMGRKDASQVYAQIVEDLTSAQGMLSQSYLTPSGATTFERVRPNVGVATALLARVYLYEGKYDSADFEASQVINNGTYSLVVNLDSAFLANNTEAIWQLELPNTGLNTNDGAFFALSYFGGPSLSFPVYLSDSLVYQFQPGDLRFADWIDSIAENGTVYYFPYKYKLYYTGVPPAEYPTLLRLSEQYLIRAEARAQEGLLTGTGGAVSDLNVVRNRAGLPVTTATSQPDILSAIWKERQFELFSEYGHRWLDLKRTQMVSMVMAKVTPEKGGSWIATDTLWPIPLADLRADNNLVQNPGYQ